MSDQLAPSTRHKFMHEGRTVYEWDQTFEEVRTAALHARYGCMEPNCIIVRQRIAAHMPHAQHEYTAMEPLTWDLMP